MLPISCPGIFPALLQPDRVADLLAQDVDHRALYEATRLPGADDRAARDFDGAGIMDFCRAASRRRRTPIRCVPRRRRTGG